jgi:hypothetical protein
MGNLSNLGNADKAKIYDDCIRESEHYQREISRIKSEYAGNIPPDKQQIINELNAKINVLVKRLESLF